MKIDRFYHATQRLTSGVRPISSRPVASRTQSKNRIARWFAVVALAALCVLPFLMPQPQHGVSVDIGSEVGLNDFGESRKGFYLFDVNPPEHDDTSGSYRWTTGFSTLRFLNIFAVGDPLLLELRACACRPVVTEPATSTLKINNAAPLSLPVDQRFRLYRLLVPHALSDYGNDLYLEFRGNTFSLPNDDRTLGIRLDYASAAPLERSWSLFGEPPVLWALYLAAVCVPWVLVRSARQETRDSRWLFVTRFFWSTFVACALFGVAYGYRPHIFTPLVLALVSVVAILGALLVGRTLMHQLALASAGLWMVWSVQSLGFWILDDAYISFRYAANMLAGQGLVFNPGERVEGYTNFLWTMIMAVPLAGGFDPTLPSAVLTQLLGLGIVWIVYRWGLRETGDARQETRDRRREIGDARQEMGNSTAISPPLLVSSLLSLFAPLLLAVNTPFLLYTARGSGMETALFTLLLVAGSMALQRATERRGLFTAGALLAAATMTRPDGVLAVAAALFYLVLCSYHDASRFMSHVSRFTSQLLPFSFGFALFFFPYYIWRFSYYGYPLPNTFYAKVGSGWTQTQRGLDYAGDFAATLGWRFVMLLLLLGFGAALWRVYSNRHQQTYIRLLRPDTLHLVALIALYSAYIIYVGGDHFPGFRFFVPIMPFVALILQSSLGAIASLYLDVNRTKDEGRRTKVSSVEVRSSSVISPVSRLLSPVWPLAASGLGALYLLFTAYQLPASDSGIAWSPVRGEYNVVEKNRELGLWLRDNTPPDTVVATGIAGALPFYSGLRVIDTLGLNDLHIAHLDVGEMGAGIAGAEKTDVPYVLDQRPTYIPYSTSGTFHGYPRFKADYRLIEVRGPEGRAIKLYTLQNNTK